MIEREGNNGEQGQHKHGADTRAAEKVRERSVPSAAVRAIGGWIRRVGGFTVVLN
jgi:hypothetical protein